MHRMNTGAQCVLCRHGVNLIDLIRSDLAQW
jgi:hypothetical protein